MTASHAQPTTTANQIPQIPHGNTMLPKNPSTTARPLRSESHAKDGTCRRDIARAAMKQLIPRQANPSAPEAKWTSPVVLIDAGRIVAQGSIAELRASRRRRLYRVEVATEDRWWEELPGVTLEREVPGGVTLLLEDGFDEQRLLDVARGAGDVAHFSAVQPTLAELFREVVPA